MGRRGHIVMYAIFSGMLGFNAYMNWSMYGTGGSETLTTMRAINMTIMPMLALLTLGQLLQLLTSPKPERILDPHATIELGEPLFVRAIRWLMLAVYAGAGLWALMRDPAGFVATSSLPVFAIVVLAIGAFGLVVLTFNPRQRMILTPQSLTYSLLRPETIAWEELADVQSKTILTSTILTLVLRDTREFRPASLLGRWRRIDKLAFNPLTYGVDPDVLERGIALRRNVFTF